jgi:hypothetical protein
MDARADERDVRRDGKAHAARPRRTTERHGAARASDEAVGVGNTEQARRRREQCETHGGPQAGSHKTRSVNCVNTTALRNKPLWVSYPHSEADVVDHCLVVIAIRWDITLGHRVRAVNT